MPLPLPQWAFCQISLSLSHRTRSTKITDQTDPMTAACMASSWAPAPALGLPGFKTQRLGRKRASNQHMLLSYEVSPKGVASYALLSFAAQSTRPARPAIMAFRHAQLGIHWQSHGGEVFLARTSSNQPPFKHMSQLMCQCPSPTNTFPLAGPCRPLRPCR